ncbi:MAG: phospholipid carrier-dependent glycosyltransferase [Novosphingobium sp.]|nr:phospholipid carrier-dependent glycosyltransferase [Novosphingobium sp.]
MARSRALWSWLDARLVALLLTIGSFALFAWNIVRPAKTYFDEVHYVPAARALIEASGPVNIEHPLLAKTIIAAGIMLFGDNSLGWRLPSAFFAAIAVAALFWLALMLLRDLKIATLAALLLVFNQTHFIQARIAMLEMPMTALLLVGACCLTRGQQVSEGARRWEYAGVIALGLAVGAKWLAIPFAVLALGLTAWAKSRARSYDLVFTIDKVTPDIVKLGLAMLGAYLITFWPAFLYSQDPMTIGGLIGHQFDMLDSQSGALEPHPYQSDWWSWPLMLRPIWYLFEQVGDNFLAILLVGNPVVYWGGLLVMLAAASDWMSQRTPEMMASIGVWVFSVLIWVILPKQIGFFYYYNFSGVVLCMVIATFFASFGALGARILAWFTALAAAMFVYFYPVISATPLPVDDSWTSWVWFESWL